MKPIPTKIDYGARLRELRHQAGLSQIELAKRADLHWQTVSKLELGGRTEPSFTTVAKLALALDVPLESFLPEAATTKPKRKRSK
jgi:transcriptional regulator with XRE-family HTH domain